MSTTAETRSEKRRHYRYVLDGSVMGAIHTLDKAPIVNISLTGALLETPEPLRAGTYHRLRLTGVQAPTSPILAKVLRSHERADLVKDSQGEWQIRYRLALTFIGAPEIRQKTLQTLIRAIRQQGLVASLPENMPLAR